MVTTRSSSVLPDPPIPLTTPKPSRTTRSSTRAAKSSSSPNAAMPWSHSPSKWTVIWMAISLPLVIWDTGYVLLRPHTMEGGSLHWPLWVPYKLYGEVDHVYGWKAFNAGNGFTGAQAALNAVETVMYLAYLWACYPRVGPRSAEDVPGRRGAQAALIGFSAAVMTLSKTVLYWLNEYYSGFDSIGHNTAIDLIFLWIIPNGAWLVGSTYMIWSIGGEILDGLVAASSAHKEE